MTGHLTVREGRRARGLVRTALLGAALCAAGPVSSQPSVAPHPSPGPVTEEAPAPDSPRTSVLSFLEFSRRGEWEKAAQYIELPAPDSRRGPELARRLKAVLDARFWIDPEQISPRADGTVDDGLPPGVEELTRLPVAGDGFVPVRLVRRETPEGERWVFSRATVNRVDDLYAALGNRWVLENLPAFLLTPGPGELLLWQWLALPLLLLLSHGAGMLLGRLTQAVLGRAASRTRTTLDNEILGRLRRPLAWAWTIVLVAIPISMLRLYTPAEQFVGSLRRAGLLVVAFWGALRILDLIGQAVSNSSWAEERSSLRALIPLLTRTGKVLLLAFAAVSALATLGYPVASLLAGLGIGGLALALAAQKTVENLFGSFAIGVDQPFREGDLVKVDDVFGFVERIGLRSSRIRTLDRTIVSIPNGRLADLRVESFAVRDRLRLSVEIGLTYETQPAQIKRILERIEATLRDHPKIWPEAVTVAFQGFGESSLNVLVMAWFLTTDWGEFLRIRQEMFFQFMEIVESEGSSFAFPTRTVHLIPTVDVDPRGGTGRASGPQGTARS